MQPFTLIYVDSQAAPVLYRYRGNDFSNLRDRCIGIRCLKPYEGLRTFVLLVHPVSVRLCASAVEWERPARLFHSFAAALTVSLVLWSVQRLLSANLGHIKATLAARIGNDP